MPQLNRLSNPRKTIIESLVEECENRKYILSDHIFSQLCSEYEMDEDIVMQLMTEVDKKIGRFSRFPTGWTFISK